MSAEDSPAIVAAGDLEPRLQECPGGPVLVRGSARVQSDDGTWHDTHRPVSAVCRCGASALLPWCDGTHKALSRRGTNPLGQPG